MLCVGLPLTQRLDTTLLMFCMSQLLEVEDFPSTHAFSDCKCA